MVRAWGLSRMSRAKWLQAFAVSRFDIYVFIITSCWFSSLLAGSVLQDEVNYVLIDVEGKEPNVIRGMGLETNRQMFPLFQYELGGTWSDSRHDTGQWGQYGIAMYLKALGYALYLMGGDGGQDAKLGR